MKGRQINNKVHHYIRQNFSLYIFSVILFVMGVFFGSMIIHSLSSNQTQEMISYINQFFHGITNTQDAIQINFKEVVFEHLKYLVIIWFLGLSIIGMPLIFLVVFMKGFIIGFTISFLIAGLQWKGFVFSMVSILPQNLLIVPVFIIASVAGISFSLSLLRSRGKIKSSNNPINFLSYTFFIFVLAGVLVLAAGFETYISPSMMKAVTTLFIKP